MCSSDLTPILPDTLWVWLLTAMRSLRPTAVQGTHKTTAMRPENREARWQVCRIHRRTAIELGLCLVLAPRVVCAQTDSKRERPREGDLLVLVDSATPEPLKTGDVPPKGKLTMAWPLDPTDNTVRDGSRLHKVLLLRLRSPVRLSFARARRDFLACRTAAL